MKKLFIIVIISFLFPIKNIYAQLYLLNEDFSSSILTNPPNNWTTNTQTGITNDKWHFDNPGNRIYNYPITVPFAIFDSENYSISGGNEIVSLNSPTVDASSNNHIYLFFDYLFKKTPTNQGIVEVFNGSTWNQVFTIDSNVTVVRTEVVDISAFAGGISNSKVRFKWSGNGSGYWIIDNIKIYAPILKDMGVTQLTSPNMPLGSGNQLIKVNIKNFGYTPITNVSINWMVNNILQTPFNWSGNLNFNQIATNITIGNLNLTSGSIYNFKIWTSNPNGSNDLNALNDTIKQVIYTSLCGTYTLGGTNPSYPDFQSAANALNYSGITCPVVIKVRDGTYNEHIILNQIIGSSTTNTIKFESESGNTDFCKLFYQMYDPTNDYTLLLNGIDNISFKKMYISRQGGAYNIIVKNNCNNVIFDENTLQFIDFDNLSIDNNFIFNKNKLNGNIKINKSDSLSTNFSFIKNNISQSITILKLTNLIIDSNTVKMIPFTINNVKNTLVKRNNFDITTIGYPGPGLILTSCYKSIIDSNLFSVSFCSNVSCLILSSNKNSSIKNNQFEFTIGLNSNVYETGIEIINSDSIFIKDNKINGLDSYGKIVGIKTRGLNSNPYGIFINGNTISHIQKGIEAININKLNIVNNTISDLDTIFLKATNCTGTISNNVMDKIVFGNGVDLKINNSTFSYNKIININEGSCLKISGNSNNIFNNFFHAGGLGNAKGIVMDTILSNSNIYFNSININSIDKNNGIALEIFSGENCNVKNNIFSNKGNGYSVFFRNIPSSLTMDYNDYYSFKRKYISHTGIIYDSLMIWKNFTGNDQHSFDYNPFYQTNNILKHNQIKLFNSAIIIPSIANDIYYSNRTVPDIGATEYTPCTIDAGIHRFYGLKNPISNTSYTIKVELQNHGNNALTTAKIAWTINGISQTIYNWTGNLPQGQTTTVNIGNFNFPPTTTYQIKAWIFLPNNSVDCNNYNDTTIIKDLSLKLCGVYTIGGTNPNFIDFNDAVNALNEAGISCPVVFKVRAGLYKEHLLIKHIQGSSLVNTVTFESENGNYNSVTLMYIPFDPNNDYTLKLDSCRNIFFKNLTIYRDSGLIDINLVNNCANVNFIGNQIGNLFSSDFDTILTIYKNIFHNEVSINHNQNGYSKNIRFIKNSSKDIFYNYCSYIQSDSNIFNGFSNSPVLNIKNSKNIILNYDTIFSNVSITNINLLNNQKLTIKNSYLKNFNQVSEYGIYADLCKDILIIKNRFDLTSGIQRTGVKFLFSDSITVSDNVIYSTLINSGDGIIADTSSINLIKILNNKIINFNNGLNIFTNSINDLVYNNEILNGKGFGIKIQGKNGIIRKNRINNISYGNGIINLSNNSKFSENRITNIFEGIAFYNNASNVILINNYIHSNGFTVSVGVKLSASDTNITLKFNNIHITGEDPQQAIPLLIDASKGISLLSNVFKNNGMGYSMIANSSLIQSNSNNNCFFGRGQFLIKNQNNSYITLNEWSNATGYDLQSKNINPFYSSDTNLQINQIQLNEAGLNDINVIRDIDSTIHSNPPDIGAKEFIPCTFDAGIDSLIGVLHNMNVSGFPITVLLQNNGSQTLTSVKIKYSINNVTQPSIYNWVGNLPGGAVTQVTIGNFTFQTGVSSIDLKCWTFLPNNNTDCNLYNDTAKFDKISLPLCGIYTIGGNNPNFINFTEAANALNLSGISCPVIFKVRNGVYNERIKIGPVMGNNITNSITFISENYNPDSVTLSYLNLDPQNDFTINLDSVINFNLLKLSILRSNGLNNIIINKHCKLIKLDSCILHNILVNSSGLDSLITVSNSNMKNKNIHIWGSPNVETNYINLKKNKNIFNIDIKKSKYIIIDSCGFLMNSIDTIFQNIIIDSSKFDTILNCYSSNGNKAMTAIKINNSENISIQKNRFIEGNFTMPVQVNFCKNIKIDKNIIKSNGYHSIDIKKGENIHIESNKISNISSIINCGIILDDTCKIIKIDSNDISNFTTGIYCKLNTLTDSLLRNHIKTRAFGINVYGDSGVVRQNQIDSSNSIVGINVLGNGLKIIQNKILTLTQSSGIIVGGNKHLVANNFINVGGLGNARGIVINGNSTLLNIIHNSINITSTDYFNGRCIEINGGNNHIFKDNIFCNSGNGYASYINTLPQNTSWDYNVYFSPLKKIGWFNNQTFDTLAVWATFLSGDANSMFINPYFVSETNLRPNQRFINGAGLLYPEVVVDIYDILRNLSAPDIGAVEFKVDFGITELINPTLACTHSANDSVKVYLKQYGDIPFTDLTIAYQVNNGLIIYDTIHGAIVNDLIHTFPVTVNLTASGTYVFKIWFTSNNDDNPNNDTLIVTRYSNIPPIITSFVAPNSCEGKTVNFNSQAIIASPFTITDYLWEFGNGDSAFIKNPSYSFDTIGTYIVSLKVYSSAGCYKDTTKTLSIFATPHAAFTTNPNCNGFPVIFNNNNTISGLDSIFYQWNFGDNSFSTLKNPTHIYNNNTNYQAFLISYTDKGCSDTATKVIQMNPPPILQLISQNSQCGLPNGFIHTQISSGTTPFTYLWSNGATTPNLENLLQGNFIVTVTDTNGCYAIDSSLIVSPVQALNVQFNSNIFICEGYSNGWIKANITGGVQPYTINWSNGQNQDSIYNLNFGSYVITISDISNCNLTDSITLYNSSNPNLQLTKTDVLCYGENTATATATPLNGIPPYNYIWFTNPNQITQTASGLAFGNYIVKVTDNAGCIGNDTIMINQPDSFNLNISYSNPLCNNGKDGSITAIVNGATPPFSYLWNTNPSQATSNINNLAEGIYILEITDSNGCIKTSSPIILSGLTQIHASFSAYPIYGIYPLPVTFTFTGSGANSFLWDFGDGNNSTLLNPTNIYLTSSNFQIILIVNSGAPSFCEDTASMILFVDKPSDIIIPNIFTPNGDGINDFFTVEPTNIIDYEIVIYNRWGREIFKSNNLDDKWDGTANGNPAAEGTYFYLMKAKGRDQKDFQLHGSVTLLR
jgi:gliding motility-associated-like protein